MRAAAILPEVAAEAEPPLRLPLVSYAHGVMSNRLEELKGQIEAIKPLTMRTDFPNGT